MVFYRRKKLGIDVCKNRGKKITSEDVSSAKSESIIVEGTVRQNKIKMLLAVADLRDVLEYLNDKQLETLLKKLGGIE